MNRPIDTPPGTFTGRHMLIVTVSGFAVVIGVNLLMAYFATRSFPGLVVANSYVASQDYNELLAQARRQEASGLRSEIGVAAGRLRFALGDRDGMPLAGLRVTAVAGRPSTTREDRSLDLVEEGGAYLAASPVPDGLWEFDVEAYRGGTLVYRRTVELLVRGGEAKHGQ